MSRTRASAKAAGTRFESQIAAYLAERVEVLGTIVNELCQEKLAEMKAALGDE